MIEIKTLEEARAAAYRGMYRGLRSQGWRQCVGHTSCRMRPTAATPEGVRACAAGWLFQNGEHSDSYMNMHAGAGALFVSGFRMCEPLQRWYEQTGSYERGQLLSTISHGQVLHDNTPCPKDLRAKFDHWGLENGWEPPSEY